ncbi:hypothetical protein [Microbacterium azadirachtae]|uniref:hypothetical protein n=1 Tax=Microbacterium azadirachtae TaxID=582680 RepID=UPI00088145AF|nr:hypothetical protein [Microbacterium azadirachtae]SDL30337.1 hypothetical protein SAMN04488593_0630 [Microbacterium azadirachtae]SEF60455.1 hypothetical protein SAMN04488594_0620 [Microbacterium azadirachtae]SEF61068.1 hypothetical protein SAMN04488592_0629 [Microbacterium azadirachtae]
MRRMLPGRPTANSSQPTFLAQAADRLGIPRNSTPDQVLTALDTQLAEARTKRAQATAAARQATAVDADIANYNAIYGGGHR